MSPPQEDNVYRDSRNSGRDPGRVQPPLAEAPPENAGWYCPDCAPTLGEPPGACCHSFLP